MSISAQKVIYGHDDMAIGNTNLIESKHLYMAIQGVSSEL